MVDLNPSGRTLAQLPLNPVVGRQNRALLRAEIRGNALGDAVGEEAADETSNGRISRELRDG